MKIKLFLSKRIRAVVHLTIYKIVNIWHYCACVYSICTLSAAPVYFCMTARIPPLLLSRLCESCHQKHFFFMSKFSVKLIILKCILFFIGQKNRIVSTKNNPTLMHNLYIPICTYTQKKIKYFLHLCILNEIQTDTHIKNKK